MPQLALILTLAILGLSSCRHDDDDHDPIRPTPTPTVTPKPTSDLNNLDETTDSLLPLALDGGTGNADTGAPMTSSSEQVNVVTIAAQTGINSTITVARSNGEVWDFDIPAISNAQVGATAIYQNRLLVFGGITGNLLFPDSSISRINGSQRVR